MSMAKASILEMQILPYLVPIELKLFSINS